MKSFLADVNIYEEEQTDGRMLRTLSKSERKRSLSYCFEETEK